MSSGWVRRSVLAVPVPFGWKLCFSSEPKTICLTVGVVLEAPPLGVALALGELEPELVQAAVPSRVATTVAPRQVAVRILKMFTGLFVGDPGDARPSGV